MFQIKRLTAREYYSRPGFKRLLAEVFKKYIGLERVGGNAKVEELLSEEAETLSDFFGKFLRSGDTVIVPLKQFGQELQRGYQLTIPQLYELLEGRPLLTRSEQKELKEEQWLSLFETVQEQVQDQYRVNLFQGKFCDVTYNWFGRLKNGQALGYRILQNVFRQDKIRAAQELKYCVDALWSLQYENQAMIKPMNRSVSWVRLPVFATQLTGDSHALDWKRSLGRLFWSALADIDSYSLQTEKQAEKNLSSDAQDTADNKFLFKETNSISRRQLYRKAGLKDDDVSSDVLVFAQPFTPLTSVSKLTLRQIEMMAVWPEYAALYVIENPSVFSTLVDEAGEMLKTERVSFDQVPADFPILICTSGQPSDAAIFFIQNCLIANPQCKLYYSGDFDVAGLQIARGLEQHFTKAFQEWHLNSETYLEYAHKGPLFSEEEKSQLEQLRIKWSQDMGMNMKKLGIKCYHEAILHELISDWIGAVRQSLENK